MSTRRVLRGFLANIEQLPPLIVSFQFNPETINDNREVNYSVPEGGDGSTHVYTGRGARKISFDLAMHGNEEGRTPLNPTALDNGISTDLAKLRSFLYPTEDAWAAFDLFGGGGADEGCAIKAPPTCVFGYGTRLLECQMISLDVKEQQFNSLLSPVKATASVTLAVIERDDHPLIQFDTEHRNVLAALGLLNVRLF